jgi:hypothetical protein
LKFNTMHQNPFTIRCHAHQFRQQACKTARR